MVSTYPETGLAASFSSAEPYETLDETAGGRLPESREGDQQSLFPIERFTGVREGRAAAVSMMNARCVFGVNAQRWNEQASAAGIMRENQR